ncbi:pentapeptide repeat-containing protein [Skermanella sp. TT6]|uniref:Pentapeptide repeat-containing protein n=1 Tax=Skermanella cutis TaxID=2775420 RepID=A0ABX7B243_9PROT|nr:pentapeptide repeat-containing protein [Skermanella sp. TT6]QQP87919.1 pentapeptide repeat-containing protein [Skermanella sp. TT6]
MTDGSVYSAEDLLTKLTIPLYCCTTPILDQIQLNGCANGQDALTNPLVGPVMLAEEFDTGTFTVTSSNIVLAQSFIGPSVQLALTAAAGEQQPAFVTLDRVFMENTGATGSLSTITFSANPQATVSIYQSDVSNIEIAPLNNGEPASLSALCLNIQYSTVTNLTLNSYNTASGVSSCSAPYQAANFSPKTISFSNSTFQNFIYNEVGSAVMKSDVDLVDFSGSTLDQTSLGSFLSYLNQLRGGAVISAKFDDADLAGLDLGAILDLPSQGIPFTISGATLSQADLSCTGVPCEPAIGKAQLTGVNLTGANLASQDLSGANLSNAILGAMDLSTNILSSTYSGVDLSGVDLTQVTLPAELANVNLSGAVLTGLDLSKADLTGANLSNTNLASTTNTKLPTKLTNVDFTGADLSGLDLSQATLTGANLSNTTLTSATNTKLPVDLTNVNFTGADLSGLALYGYTLTGATLEGTNLTGATLMDPGQPSAPLGYLQGIAGNSLASANLSNVVLNSVDLSSFTLTGANLTGADLSNSILPPDLSDVTLSQTLMGNVSWAAGQQQLSLTGATLKTLDLTTAAMPSMVDLTNTIVDGVTFQGLELCNVNLAGMTATGTDFSETVIQNAFFAGATFDSQSTFENANIIVAPDAGTTATCTASGSTTGAGAAQNTFSKRDRRKRRPPAAADHRSAERQGREKPAGKLTSASSAQGPCTGVGGGAPWDGSNQTTPPTPFEGTAFLGTNLDYASFAPSDGTTGVNFASVVLSNDVVVASVQGTDFGPAPNFNSACLDYVQFDDNDFAGASFDSALLVGAGLGNSSLVGASFSAATIAGTNFLNSDLSNASFGTAAISANTYANDSQLTNFTCAMMGGADLSQAIFLTSGTAPNSVDLTNALLLPQASYQIGQQTLTTCCPVAGEVGEYTCGYVQDGYNSYGLTTYGLTQLPNDTSGIAGTCPNGGASPCGAATSTGWLIGTSVPWSRSGCNMPSVSPLTCSSSGTVTVTDENLLACLDKANGLAPGTQLTQAQVAATQSIDCPGMGIASLDGLAAFTNLSALNVSDNHITGIPDLSALTSLTTLNIDGNRLTSIEASDLPPTLLTLSASDNQITQVTLTGLDALTMLNLSGNQIEGISLLFQFNLVSLDLSTNQLQSLNLAAGSPWSLASVNLSFNQLTSIGSVAALYDDGQGALTVLNLSGNPNFNCTSLDIPSSSALCTGSGCGNQSAPTCESPSPQTE